MALVHTQQADAAKQSIGLQQPATSLQQNTPHNIVGYLMREQRTFSEEPFNVVDGLVLATLSYLKYESNDTLNVTSAETVLLRDIIAETDRETLLRVGWMKNSPHTEAFLRALQKSTRFRGARVCLYVDEHVDNSEKQFSAVTFLLGDGRAYIAFRGTDGTMVGWKENFNIIFREFTPAQLTAVSYTSGVASAFPGNLVLIGHSKGGSNAQYATLCVPEPVFNRIDMTLNFDGPSFLSDPSPRVQDSRFHEIFHKIVPEGSLFGLLLEQGNNYRVIGSPEKVSRQHEPFSWMVSDTDFCYVNDLRKRAKWADGTLNAWMKSRTVEEREVFIDAIYDLLRATNAQTIFELRDRLGANLPALVHAIRELNPTTRKALLETLGKLGGALRTETRKALAARHNERKTRQRPLKSQHRK